MPRQRTTDLDLAYRDLGAKDARTVLLLHGWPDDAAAWDPVADALVAGGFRVIVPSLRGFGDTRFLDPDAPRTGNSAIHALDMIELVDALGLGQVVAVGHDWGAIIAEALTIGWPGRVSRLALLATQPLHGGVRTPPFWRAALFWYHWFLATGRGAEAVRQDPIGFARYQWEAWSPPGWFDEQTFEQTAVSWKNPDFADVTIHSYRSRWGEAEFDPRSAWLEAVVESSSPLTVPCLYLQGEEDRVNPPAATERVGEKFGGPFLRVVLPGVGHFPAREDPDGVSRHLLAFCRGETP